MIKLSEQIKEIRHYTDCHTPLQIRARRFLIGFFVIMFVLTVASRAANSITVAQVTAQSPQSGMLTFEAEGTGIITADAKKYIRTPEGIGIEQINVNAGQKVNKGDILFTLNKKDIKNALNTATQANEKLKLQIEQEKYSTTDPSLSEQDIKQAAYINAKKDLLSAKSDLKDAKDSLKEAQGKVSEAEADYQQTKTKSIDEIYNDKKQELTEAKNSYQNVSLSNKDSYKNATRALEDADASLQELEQTDTAVIKYLGMYSDYYDTDSMKTEDALESLLYLVYGDKDSYEKHIDKVFDLNKKLARANEDYDVAVKEYHKQIGMIDDLSSYESAVTAAKRIVNDTEEEITSENAKENRLKAQAENYRKAYIDSDQGDMNYTLARISQIIYGYGGYDNHRSAVAKAKKKVTQAKEDLDATQDKNTVALSVEQEKLDKIQRILTSIEAGTYDSRSAVAAEKQAFDTAKQELKTQKQAIRTAQKAIDTAKNAVLTARLEHSHTIKQDKQNTMTFAKQKKASALRVKALECDLKEKQGTLKDLTLLYEQKGKVTSPVSGTIDTIAMEAGKKSTSDNSIAINADGFGIIVTIPKDEGEYVSVGDKIKLIQKGKKDTVTVNAESIHFTKDTQGNDITEVTAVMPKGDYILGASLDASITKNSDLYDMCIPVSAVRNDTSGAYCFVTEARDTVLGKELLAVRKNIKVIDSDARNAVIDGSLTSDDNVIISSSKNINEDDRVRLKQ